MKHQLNTTKNCNATFVAWMKKKVWCSQNCFMNVCSIINKTMDNQTVKWNDDLKHENAKWWKEKIRWDNSFTASISCPDSIHIRTKFSNSSSCVLGLADVFNWILHMHIVPFENILCLWSPALLEEYFYGSCVNLAGLLKIFNFLNLNELAHMSKINRTAYV